MRRMLAAAVAVAVAIGMLGGCTPGPNQEAVKAAASYAKKLEAWAPKVTAAVADAKTWTQAEIDKAGDADMLYEETGMGEVLDQMPKLEKFEKEAVADTPVYRETARIAAEVAAAATELKALEPESVKALRSASLDAWYVVGDLYYNTLGGPATERRKAEGDVWDVEDPIKQAEMLRAAEIMFAEERGKLLDVAITQMKGEAEGRDRPVIPESTFGRSIGAFVLAWFEEEKAFQAGAVKLLSESTVIDQPYRGFWPYANVNTVFRAPVERAAALRPALAAVIEHQAASLDDVGTTATPEPDASAATPSAEAPTRVGDVYRRLLIDGYIPWGGPGEGYDVVMDRLWMLWRIRELEKTPDAAYELARATLLEELDRSTEENQAIDFRPGWPRMLTIFENFEDAFALGVESGENERVLVGLKETVAFAKEQRRYPTTPEVAADFDKLIAHLDRIVSWAEEGIENAGDDPVDQYRALEELRRDYPDDVSKLLEPSGAFLDDDERFSAALAERISGTSPELAKPVPSPSPSGSGK